MGARHSLRISGSENEPRPSGSGHGVWEPILSPAPSRSRLVILHGLETGFSKCVVHPPGAVCQFCSLHRLPSCAKPRPLSTGCKRTYPLETTSSCRSRYLGLSTKRKQPPPRRVPHRFVEPTGWPTAFSTAVFASLCELSSRGGFGTFSSCWRFDAANSSRDCPGCFWSICRVDLRSYGLICCSTSCCGRCSWIGRGALSAGAMLTFCESVVHYFDCFGPRPLPSITAIGATALRASMPSQPAPGWRRLPWNLFNSIRGGRCGSFTDSTAPYSPRC